MITIVSKPELAPCKEDKADIVIVHYEPGLEIPGKFTQLMRRPLKVFGLLSTAAWSTAALAPNVLNVPQSIRPWVFVTFIFWFFGFCAGLFNL